MSNPLVSICIPTYNREKYLKHTIESALKQIYSNIEIIVSDNASDDNTVNLVKSFKDKRIHLIVQKKNIGMVPNWNACIKKARGEYIKFVASDDLIDPNAVSQLVKPINKDSSISIVTCKRRLIDETGKTVSTLQYSNQDSKVDGMTHARWILKNIRQNKIGEPTSTLFRRTDAIKAGLFDPQFSQFADFEFWIRLLAIGDLYYLNQALCSFRTHPDSGTTQSQHNGKYIGEIFKLIEKYYHNPKLKKTYGLTDGDETSVKSKRTLDIVKSIKDLFIQGNITQAARFYSLLNQHLSLSKISSTTISHLLKS